jgi:hypothetical protein
MNYALMAVMFFAVSTAPASIAPVSVVPLGPHVIVTAEGAHGTPPPEVKKDDVSVAVDRRPTPLEDWTPLRGNEASLELYIVIDEGDDTRLGIQFNSLKNFIREQPDTTKIGLAYLRNGAANIVAPLTAAHEDAVRALRVPLGEAGISASPYMGISDLVKKWHATDARREVLLIVSGIDPWSPADPENPYLEQAIADAQRADVLVHSIYYAEAGALGHSLWRLDWGQNYLSELGEKTGGAAYWQGLHSPVSFDPFLKDLAQRLKNQYRATIAPQEKESGLASVRVTASEHGISLMAASNINMKTAH